MRVAIVTESFLPHLNGVTTSVARVSEQLSGWGHAVTIIAPRAPDGPSSPDGEVWAGARVHRVRSVPVRQFDVGLPSPSIEGVLERFEADVVHVASPFVLGARGLLAARRLGLPSVAVYQTDMAAYVRQHAPGGAAADRLAGATWRWIRRVHSWADRTLAPSTAARDDLLAHGVERVALWPRGVDTAQFSPTWSLDAAVRGLRRHLHSVPGSVSGSGSVPGALSGSVSRAVDPTPRTCVAGDRPLLVGYVGRIAPEKELERLAELADLPGMRLVVVGDGPARAQVQAQVSAAVRERGVQAAPVFLGARTGDDLARAYASLDLFVHTGTHETFGQTIQEAAATGLPVIAPAVGGPVDLVEHGRTGRLFDPLAHPHSPDSLRSCVHDLLTCGEPARRAAGALGASRVAGRSWTALSADLLGHYASAQTAHALGGIATSSVAA